MVITIIGDCIWKFIRISSELIWLNESLSVKPFTFNEFQPDLAHLILFTRIILSIDKQKNLKKPEKRKPII